MMMKLLCWLGWLRPPYALGNVRDNSGAYQVLPTLPPKAASYHEGTQRTLAGWQTAALAAVKHRAACQVYIFGKLA